MLVVQCFMAGFIQTQQLSHSYYTKRRIWTQGEENIEIQNTALIFTKSMVC